MISLTTQTNQSFFNGRTEVSCNTCHRGATHPVSQPVLPQAQPPFPTPVAERPALPSLTEIIDKYAKALGNTDAGFWTSTTMAGVRESPDGSSGQIEIAEHGPDMRVHFIGPKAELTQVVTANGGWTRDEGGTKDMTANSLENFRSLRDSFPLPMPKEIPADARVVNRTTIDGIDAWLVVAPLRDRYQQRLYFNVANGLLMRRIIVMQTPIGNVPQQTDFGDYRNVNGAMVPFTVSVASVDPWIGSTRRYSEVHLGARVEDAVFQK